MLDFDDVEDDAIEVQEHAVAETDVVAVVAKERRPDHRVLADMAETFGQQRVPLRHRRCQRRVVAREPGLVRSLHRPASSVSPDDTVRPQASFAFRSCSADCSELRKRVGRGGQLRAGPGAVVVHLPDQRVDAVELQFVADEADKGDIERGAIEVALEVEQEHFQQRRAIVEGRTAAEACDAVKTFLIFSLPRPTRTA